MAWLMTSLYHSRISTNGGILLLYFALCWRIERIEIEAKYAINDLESLFSFVETRKPRFLSVGGSRPHIKNHFIMFLFYYLSLPNVESSLVLVTAQLDLEREREIEKSVIGADKRHRADDETGPKIFCSNFPSTILFHLNLRKDDDDDNDTKSLSISLSPFLPLLLLPPF